MDNSLDVNITPNTKDIPTSFDIHVSVVPGHDMVVNHVDGSQELASGEVAQKIMATEATNGGKVVSVASVTQPAEQPHRSVADPETNQPSVSEVPEVVTEDKAKKEVKA